MSAPRLIPVELAERAYAIRIEAGLLERLGEVRREAWTSSDQPPSQWILISDTDVAPLYARQVAAGLAAADVPVRQVIVPAGEKSKSVRWLDTVWQDVLAGGADRDSVVVALGGGVVGDLAGFVAATYARGIPLVQIPTSLLAQVDSSVGGKVGINLPGGKNLVGAFWQPRTVWIDPHVLTTLRSRDYRSGLAEIVKYGVILDADFFSCLEEHAAAIADRDPALMETVIARCCELKAEVVVADECETSGRRAILNYGHTFGHAIENVFGYGAYTHGEAIAIGMDCAARLAARLGHVSQSFVERQRALLETFELPTSLKQVDRELAGRLVDAMQRDKKIQQGELKLILPRRIGEVVREPAPPRDWLEETFQT